MIGRPLLPLMVTLRTAGTLTLTKRIPERKTAPRHKTSPLRMILKRNPQMTKLPQPHSSPRRSESERLLSVVRRPIKPLLPHDPPITSDRPFAVFLVTSIPERPSFSTRFDRPTSRREKLVVLLSRSVLHTSLSKPSSRRQLSSTKTASSTSRSLVFLSSTPLVTSLSPTSDLAVLRSVTLLFWSLISCTVSSPRPSSPCVC